MPTDQPERSGVCWGWVWVALAVLVLCLAGWLARQRAVEKARVKNATIKVVMHGQEIFEALRETRWRAREDAVSATYPETREGFETSTEYLRDCWTNNDLAGFDSSYFGAPGLARAFNPTNPAEFGPQQNAWCITLDVVAGDPDMVPILFTRNLCFTGTTLNTVVGLDKNAQPFGDTFGIVVQKGGRAMLLEKREIMKYFSGITATNAFLRP